MRIKLLIVIGLVLVSCKKEISSGKWGHSPDCDEVFDMTFVGVAGIVYFSEDSTQFKYPTVNPDNPDEILYQYINHNTFTFQLKKYNIKTRLNQVLVDNVMLINPPAWSKNGKIVFEVPGNELYLTDEYGSHPVIFGPKGANQKPTWMKEGDRFVFFHINPQTFQTHTLSLSVDQQDIDTLKSPGSSNFVISDERVFLASSGDNFYSFDLKIADFFTNADLIPVPFSMAGGGAGGGCVGRQTARNSLLLSIPGFMK